MAAYARTAPKFNREAKPVYIAEKPWLPVLYLPKKTLGTNYIQQPDAKNWNEQVEQTNGQFSNDVFVQERERS